MPNRFILPAVLVCLAAACGDPAPVAPDALLPSAARGSGGPPEDVDLDLVLSGLCDFTIRFVPTGKSKVITLPGGRSIWTTPGAHATLTNLENGRSVTLNITAPFHQTVLPDGNIEVVATGRALIFDPAMGFMYTNGRFSFTMDASGNLVTPLTGTGKITDVCALIA